VLAASIIRAMSHRSLRHQQALARESIILASSWSTAGEVPTRAVHAMCFAPAVSAILLSSYGPLPVHCSRLLPLRAYFKQSSAVNVVVNVNVNVDVNYNKDLIFATESLFSIIFAPV
jgi:hypothetical protein